MEEYIAQPGAVWDKLMRESQKELGMNGGTANRPPWHNFLKRLYETNPLRLLRVYTQEINGEIRHLGIPSELVVEMRGSMAIERAYCAECGHRHLDVETLNYHVWKWRRKEGLEGSGEKNSPLGECPKCGSVIVPGIVFEESRGPFCDFRDFRSCDLVIMIGNGPSLVNLVGMEDLPNAPPPCIVLHFVDKDEAVFRVGAIDIEKSLVTSDATNEHRQDLLTSPYRTDIHLYAGSLARAFTTFVQHTAWFHLPAHFWDEVCCYLSDEDLCEVSRVNYQFHSHAQRQWALRVCSYVHLSHEHTTAGKIIQMFPHIHWRRVLIRLTQLIYFAKELELATQMENNLDFAVAHMMQDFEDISQHRPLWKCDIVHNMSNAADLHQESLLSSLSHHNASIPHSSVNGDTPDTPLLQGTSSMFSPSESMNSISTLLSNLSMDESFSVASPGFHLVPVAASSTLKHFYLQHMTDNQPGNYWCSAPSEESSSCEYLLFRFSCDLAFLNTIRLQAYETDGIIFSPQKVQFFSGYMTQAQLNVRRRSASDYSQILDTCSWCVSPELSFPPDTYFPVEFQLTRDSQMMGNFLCVKLIGRRASLSNLFLVALRSIDVIGGIACEDLVTETRVTRSRSTDILPDESMSNGTPHPFVLPNEEERRAAIALRQIDEHKRVLFTPFRDFKPLVHSDDLMDWTHLAHHYSDATPVAQTFVDFQREYHLMNSSTNLSEQAVCILPIGAFEVKSAAHKIEEVVSAFLPGMHTCLLPAIPFGNWRDDFRVSLRNTKSNTLRRSTRVRFRLSAQGVRQVCAESVLAKFSPVPQHALSLIIITEEEVYSQVEKDIDHILQRVNVSSRVSVVSLSSLKKWMHGRDITKKQKLQFIRESAQLVLHEVLRIQGMADCVYYDCLMNGVGSDLHEGRLSLLCPICLHKLQYIVGEKVDVIHHMLRGNWATFVASHWAFHEEMRWTRKRLATLKKYGIELAD